MRQKKYVFGNFSPLWCWIWRFCLFVRGLVGPVHCLNNQRGIPSPTRTHLYIERTTKTNSRFFRFSRFRSSQTFAGFAAFSALSRFFACFRVFLPVSPTFVCRLASFVRLLTVSQPLFCGRFTAYQSFINRFPTFV